MDNVSERVNVAVYIDYENIYKTLLKARKNVLRMGFFERLRKWCRNNNQRIVQISVYCNFDNADLYESYHQSMLQNYGVETIHTSNQGKNYADLKITIDVLKDMYSNSNIDEFFIISNDKDMTPLLNTIRANKRNVTVVTAGSSYNPILCEFADRHISIEEICKTDVDHLIINDFMEAYYDKMSSFISKQLPIPDENTYFKHCGLEWVLENEPKYMRLMNYEIATIIKELYDQHRIFFYRYKFKSDYCKALAPVDQQQTMLSQKIFQNDDIIESIDINTIIDSLYNKAQNAFEKSH